MFLRILRKSLLKRKSRIAIAIISVMIGAAIATALISVSLDVGEKVGLEFRKYGANLMVIPYSDTISVGFPGVDFGSVTEQRYINETDLWKIKTIYWRNSVMGFTPLLYQVVSVDNGENRHPVVLAGTYFNTTIIIHEPYSPYDDPLFVTGIENINPWWTVNGSWISDQNDTTSAMIGKKVAKTLNLTIDDSFTIYYDEYVGDAIDEVNHTLTVVGIIETEGHEDDQIFVNLHVAQTLTNRPGKVHTVQVSALCNACPVEEFAMEIEEVIPYVHGKTLRQLAYAEMGVLAKVENMMLLITIIALIASAVGVMTTMMTSVIERQKEIGLMKSIGAENRKIIALFLSEAAIIGVLGGIMGYIIGFIISQVIGTSSFSTAITPRFEIILLSVVISVGVSLLASILPIRRAVKIEPAIVLRGE